MTWRLFIDDDCDTVRRPSITVENTAWRARMNLPLTVPQTAGLGEWVFARDAASAIEAITERGMPDFISFDHDLGDGRDAMAVVHWIIERDLDGYPIPHTFEYEVHSGNPVGRSNIRNLLSGYLDFRHREEAERGKTADGPGMADPRG